MSMEFKTASSTTSLSSTLSVLAVDETNVVPYKIPSNHFSTAITYQSSEVLTGDIWLDGKPIYRKIIAFVNLTYGSDITIDSSITLTYVDSLVKCNGYIKHTSGIYPLVYAYELAVSYGFSYYIKNTGLSIHLGSSYSSTNKGHIILEYTKA